MAARHARLDLSKLSDFFAAWEQQLSHGAVVIPPGVVEGELAPEFKLDLQVPAFGRIGPIPCQIIQRMPDGGTAARVPEMPVKVIKVAERLAELLEEAKQLLLDRGELVEPGAAPPPAAPPPAAPEVAPEAPPEPEEDAAQEDSSAPEQPSESESIDPSANQASEAAPRELPRRAGPRGFPLPQLDGAPAHQGRLGDRSLRDTLVRLAAAQTHGVLVVDGDVKRYGYWSEGGPVGWRSEPAQAEETLGSLLQRSGQLDPDTHARAEALMESHGLRLAESLVALGALNEEQQELVLRRQTEFLFKHVLGLRRGTWAFHALPAAPDGDFLPEPVHVVSFLFRTLCAHAASLPEDRVLAAIGGRGREWVSINGELIEVLATGRWSHAEQAMLLAVRRKPARVNELLDALGGGKDVAVAMLSFAELGLLRLDRVGPSDPAQLHQQVEQRIRAKHGRVMADHHFDALEVHWAALGHEIDAAWEARRQEFSRDAYAGISEELGEMVDAIAARVREAHTALRDAGRRQRYRAEVIDEELLLAVAERFAQEAEAAGQAGQSQKARECWGRAAELRPDEDRYARGLRAAGG